jgi:hypothetical protein
MDFTTCPKWLDDTRVKADETAENGDYRIVAPSTHKAIRDHITTRNEFVIPKDATFAVAGDARSDQSPSPVVSSSSDMPVDDATLITDAEGNYADAVHSNDMVRLMSVVSDKNSSDILLVRLGSPIITSRIITSFHCTNLQLNGSSVDTGVYRTIVTLPSCVPIESVITLQSIFDKATSPLCIHSVRAPRSVDVRVSLKCIRHETRLVEMELAPFYQMCIKRPFNDPNVRILPFIGITDLDMRGRISLYGYLYALWSTCMVRFLTNAYNQYKTLRWCASVNHSANYVMEDITVRSQIGKTNFSVDVNYESDVVCKMKGRWIQVPLLDNLNTMKPISATRIAPTFRMRNMTDAIRSISIVSGMLFGGISKQLELAANLHIAIVLSDLSYEIFTVHLNVDLAPHISILEVVNDQEFHVRILYYDTQQTLSMSATGKWISVDITTSKCKKLPTATVAGFMQLFEEPTC